MSSVKLAYECIKYMEDSKMIEMISNIKFDILQLYESNLPNTPKYSYNVLDKMLSNNLSYDMTKIIKSFDYGQILGLDISDYFKRYLNIKINSNILLIFTKNSIYKLVTGTEIDGWNSVSPMATTSSVKLEDSVYSVIYLRYREDYQTPSMFHRNMLTHELVHAVIHSYNISISDSIFKDLEKLDHEFIADYVSYFISNGDDTITRLRDTLPNEFCKGVCESYTPYLDYLQEMMSK